MINRCEEAMSARRVVIRLSQRSLVSLEICCGGSQPSVLATVVGGRVMTGWRDLSRSAPIVSRRPCRESTVDEQQQHGPQRRHDKAGQLAGLIPT